MNHWTPGTRAIPQLGVLWAGCRENETASCGERNGNGVRVFYRALAEEILRECTINSHLDVEKLIVASQNALGPVLHEDTDSRSASGEFGV